MRFLLMRRMYLRVTTEYSTSLPHLSIRKIAAPDSSRSLWLMNSTLFAELRLTRELKRHA